MKAISKFIKRNTLIFAFFIVSVIIITSYIFTTNLPELFAGAEHWYNLLFQLSIGYIINFMFYITQIYIPNSKRDLTVRQCISARLNGIIRDMRSSISSLAQLYLENHTGDEYKEDELNQLLNLRFSDKVQVLNASRTTRDNFVYFTVREWLSECIRKTENGIDSLYKYYASDISVDLMLSLEDVLNSTYHTMMKTLLAVPNDVNFSDSNNNFFVTYYRLIRRLEEIKQNDYK
ncbi:hypothetical protein Psfp_03778 [Pelotomaculum sp. FP]|uniref:hypothetical protein n=1 Tax=Pelotomaculum sp. FP TaxID=261474 RepID=UPI001065604C|nr:hypothetical protein [Pelotomaculum sp. FP]TEB12297.1 hypothetical protein Psfp_03778 [Pelotomaculum sp. FP]